MIRRARLMLATRPSPAKGKEAAAAAAVVAPSITAGTDTASHTGRKAAIATVPQAAAESKFKIRSGGRPRSPSTSGLQEAVLSMQNNDEALIEPPELQQLVQQLHREREEAMQDPDDVDIAPSVVMRIPSVKPSTGQGPNDKCVFELAETLGVALASSPDTMARFLDLLPIDRLGALLAPLLAADMQSELSEHLLALAVDATSAPTEALKWSETSMRLQGRIDDLLSAELDDGGAAADIAAAAKQQKKTSTNKTDPR